MSRCDHYAFEAVRLLVTDELVGYVCTDCYEPLPRNWRAEERFDAAVALLNALDDRLYKMRRARVDVPETLRERRNAVWRQARDHLADVEAR